MHMPGSGGWDDTVALRAEVENTEDARVAEIAAIVERSGHAHFPLTQFAGTPEVCIEP